MNPAQKRAILLVDESVSFLARKLMEEYDVSEDEAIEALYQDPQLVKKVQDGRLEEVYSDTRVRMIDSPHNPKEFYPGHYAYKAPLTTKDTFNAHVAQAITPYVMAIAKRVAKDRGLEPPNEQEITSLLEKSDWAKAAYEAQRMPKNPSFPRLRQFLSKYIGTPLKKLDEKIPIEKVFALATSGTLMWVIWATFKNHMYEVGRPPVDAFRLYGDYKQQRTQKKFLKQLHQNYGR